MAGNTQVSRIICVKINAIPELPENNKLTVEHIPLFLFITNKIS
jgi:hypothetical protein